MKLKKTVALALVTAMTATMAAGCGGSSSDKGAAPNTTAAGSEAADSKETKAPETGTGEKQKLTVSVWDNDATPQFSSVTKAFMEKYPDVEVEFIDAPSDEYNNKVTVMLAGGDSDPDVIFVKDTENQVTMKDKNQILNLDEYIAKDGIDLTMYNGVADQLKMDGSSYTLPFRKDWYMLYYNKDLFDKAGVEYPSEMCIRDRD